ncbi:type II secretion system major pseudopilin GspG [Rhizobium laguerreae]|uniref:type II secretion system major pseudopilin GspG n=1 Tax=Rhizobium laguerreae TaxID=1076926 RepID=UPI001C9157EA|nr:type II secretion system major pseudopilin GspG [Rhizobium laguerreae]MBY3328766.1 type II secretion system major pseudopilin GspG [Rhizobium laguerreae]
MRSKIPRLWLTRPVNGTSAYQDGFTLVEVLVVLAIIGLIMGLAAPRVLNYLSSSKERAAHLQIQSLSTALELFYLDMGRYPTSSEGLQALVAKPAAQSASWNGPYLKGQTLPSDPWGQAYVYRFPGQSDAFDIVSYGPSGQEGGQDNVASWQR